MNNANSYSGVWVAVKERLPEKGRFLVVVKPVLSEPFTTTALYAPQELAYVNGWNISGVTHWMPLPEIPPSATSKGST